MQLEMNDSHVGGSYLVINSVHFRSIKIIIKLRDAVRKTLKYYTNKSVVNTEALMS